MTARRGFTLVEAIVTITVLGILGSVASLTLAEAVAQYADSATAGRLYQEANDTMERIAAEIRQIPPAGQGGPAITRLEPDRLQAQGGWSLQLIGAGLRLHDQGPPGVIQTDVSDFRLTAFDEAGDQLPASVSGPQTSDIRRIGVSLTLSRDGIEASLATTVFIRSTAVPAP
ncbi:MAG: type II secretion system protein [Phycisphaerales bacterium JB039]